VPHETKLLRSQSYFQRLQFGNSQEYSENLGRFSRARDFFSSPVLPFRFGFRLKDSFREGYNSAAMPTVFSLPRGPGGTVRVG